MTSPAQTSPVRDRLRSRLTAAMRERDRGTVGVVRSVLAALDNAEAVPAASPEVTGSEHVAGSLVGVGVGEHPRRALTPDQERAVVDREVEEMRTAAEQLVAAGQRERAAELVRAADVIEHAVRG